MNIFCVDEDARVAARSLNNAHVVKMPVESAQLMSMAIHARSKSVYEKFSDSLYKPTRTHMHHPCTKWVIESEHNFAWLLEHARELSAEYTRRYRKLHGSSRIFMNILIEEAAHQAYGVAGDKNKHTPFAQAMPDKYKQASAISAYRSYYIGEKLKFRKSMLWEPRAKRPAWAEV